MPLRTDPSTFSITAFLADQVTLLARHEGISPGAAVLRLRELSEDGQGRRHLLDVFAEAGEHERDPAEADKIAAVHRETLAWIRHAECGTLSN